MIKIKETWNSLTTEIKLAAIVVAAYITYPALYAAVLEFWCIAYGASMQLGLI